MDMDDDSLAASLIPGLPNDLALQCLARIPRIRHGSLKIVNSAWRSAMVSSFFHQERRRLGLVEESVFIVRGVHPSLDILPLVECVEFDMRTQKTSKVLASWTQDVATRMFLRGQACVQVRESVFFVGGFQFFCSPSCQVYRFCILTQKMSSSRDMLTPRADFAWGVIDDCLYVAGGKISATEWTDKAEMYEVRTDLWSPIASMPKPLQIHVFFRRGKKVFIKGLVKRGEINEERHRQVTFSYDPQTNSWKEEEDSLSRHIGHGRCAAVSTESGDLVCAALESYIGFFSDDSPGTALRITRQMRDGRWEVVKDLEKVCTMSAVCLHSSLEKAVIVIPYDLSSASRWDFMGAYKWGSCSKEILEKEKHHKKQEVVLIGIGDNKDGGALVVEVCVKCCYCYACCFTSALLSL